MTCGAALFARLRDLGGARRTFVATDPGVTGLLALGRGMSDVKMHMGAAVPIAAGWSAAMGERGLSVAVVGDTNLFHSEWLGLLEASAANDNLLVVVVDNHVSEMTARIRPLRPSEDRARESLAALGMQVVHLQGAQSRWNDALGDLAMAKGVRVLWLELDD